MKKIMMIVALMMFGVGLAAAGIPVQNTNADILGILAMIDQNEIEAAQLAEQKNIHHQVMDYAKMLDQDHHRHLTQVQGLSQKLGIVAADDPVVEGLRTQGKKDLDALSVLDGRDFSQLYIADMVKGHSEALNWLEAQGSNNPQVKELLKQTRGVVAMHLKKATQIQGEEL